MTDQSMKWRRPFSPWRIVQLRFFPEGLDVVVFCRKYGLDESKIRPVFGESDYQFPPELCVALSLETKRGSQPGMSTEFFRNLSDQYQRHAA